MDLDDFFGEHRRHHDHIKEQLELIMTGLSDLQAAVAANTTLSTEAIALIKKLTSAGDSDTQVGALAATLAKNNTDLGAAITAATPALTFTPSSVPTPVVGSPYSQVINTSGGTGAVALSVTAGALPPGAGLNGNVLSWNTPVSPTTANFTITATDSVGVTANLPVSWSL